MPKWSWDNGVRGVCLAGLAFAIARQDVALVAALIVPLTGGLFLPVVLNKDKERNGQ